MAQILRAFLNFLYPTVTHASNIEVTPIGSIKAATPTTNTVAGYLNNIINLLGLIAGAFAVYFIISAGIRYITSSGNKTGADAAKNQLINAVIGICIVLIAYSIIKIGVTLGTSVNSLITH
jgi:type IV secretory pathway VirB2 component (pilin)